LLLKGAVGVVSTLPPSSKIIENRIEGFGDRLVSAFDKIDEKI